MKESLVLLILLTSFSVFGRFVTTSEESMNNSEESVDCPQETLMSKQKPKKKRSFFYKLFKACRSPEKKVSRSEDQVVDNYTMELSELHGISPEDI